MAGLMSTRALPLLELDPLPLAESAPRTRSAAHGAERLGSPAE